MGYMGTNFLRGRKKTLEPLVNDNRGFIPLILSLLAILIAVIVLVYVRVLNAQK
jgi:hypothetical protein